MHTLQQTPACHPVPRGGDRDPRGGDRDPREQEGPAGLAHGGEAKGLRLLPLKTSAGEARGREKLFKLPYNADIRTTRFKLPVNKAGLGITGFFTAGGGGLRNYLLAEGWRGLSSAPGHNGSLQPLSFAPFPLSGNKGSPKFPNPGPSTEPSPWRAGDVGLRVLQLLPSPISPRRLLP